MITYLSRILLVLLFAIALAYGQDVAPAKALEADPLQCWWRTSAGAVRVGEIFQLVLTCSVLETEALKVVPDQSPLDPNTIQMPPFEVAGGARNADLSASQHRFFQYEYRLRVMSQDLFGRDARLPEMKIAYRVQSRSNTGAAVEGIEKSYVLPPLSVRILSLVPADASDIRDASPTTFADIEGRSFRANILTAVAAILFALAALLAILAVVGVTKQRQSEAGPGSQPVPDLRVLEAVLAELAAITRDRRVNGWTMESIGRLFTALRIVSGYALGRPAGQIAPEAGEDVRPGHLLVRYRRSRFARPLHFFIAGSVTGQTISAEIGRLSSAPVAEHAVILGEMERALAELTITWYGRDAEVNNDLLDSNLESGIRAARNLRKEHTWLVRKLRAFHRATAEFGERVWVR